VTVTLPVHALVGKRLPVVHLVRGDDGRRYVMAEHPGGWSIRLPIEWTDRAAPLAAPRVRDREVRADARGLLALAAAVDVACEKLGPPDRTGSRPRHADASPEGQPAPVVDAVDDGTARPARRVGDSRAQSASRRGGSRRKDR
jgi:hypothetical protein